MSAVAVEDRAVMWENFLWSCALGTVVQAADTTVWQKRDKYAWVRMGHAGDYNAQSIAWPVQVLSSGTE